MKIPQPVNMQYSSIKHELEKGTIKVPKFQRDFVWKKIDSAKLIDSLLKGYPIGSFILWSTREELCSIRNIGNIKFADIPGGERISYVLDGQQRITSIYAVFEGLTITRSNGKNENFEEIYIDLDAEVDSDAIVTTEIDRERSDSFISVHDVIYGSIELFQKYNKYYSKLDSYKAQINSYPFSTISVEIGLDEATDIFTRLNVGGKELSTFEIMCAKAYDPNNNFDLLEKYEQLESKLEESGYGTIPSSVFFASNFIVCYKRM